MEPPIRSFVAIDLTATVRQQIKELIEDLRKSDAPVGWVRVEGIHLTLKFLGNIAPQLLERIKPALMRVAGQTEPLRIEPQGCGAFPDSKAPRVIWVGLGGRTAPLAQLARRVEKELVPLGFKPEQRSFRPHLTVGRVKGRRRLHSLQELLISHADFAAEPFDAAQILLYKSELRPDGARYSPLFKTLLSGTPATADE